MVYGQGAWVVCVVTGVRQGSFGCQPQGMLINSHAAYREEAAVRSNLAMILMEKAVWCNWAWWWKDGVVIKANTTMIDVRREGRGVMTGLPIKGIKCGPVGSFYFNAAFYFFVLSMSPSLWCDPRPLGGHNKNSCGLLHNPESMDTGSFLGWVNALAPMNSVWSLGSLHLLCGEDKCFPPRGLFLWMTWHGSEGSLPLLPLFTWHICWRKFTTVSL